MTLWTTVLQQDGPKTKRVTCLKTMPNTSNTKLFFESRCLTVIAMHAILLLNVLCARLNQRLYKYYVGLAYIIFGYNTAIQRVKSHEHVIFETPGKTLNMKS